MRKDTLNVLKNIMKVQVQTQTLALRSHATVKVDTLFARRKIMQFLPLDELNDCVDTLFEAPECQRLLLEQMQRILMIRGMNEPSENEVCIVFMELCFSQYLRAHMIWGAKKEK